jgi:hypothetical protein
MILQIEVTKSSLQSYWYAKRVGEIFYAVDTFGDTMRYLLVEEGVKEYEQPNRYFNKADVKILSEFNGKIVTETITSILGKPEND